jgi:hypothetical protein
VGVLYADEHFPAPVVEELRRLGHDVESGLAERIDAAIRAESTLAGRVVRVYRPQS